MNQQEFTYILENPKFITNQQTDALKSVLSKYPYFQSARAVYLKGLKNQNSLSYNNELKVTAAYTTDRSILFDFITSEEFIQNEISQHISQNIASLKEEYSTEQDIEEHVTENIDVIAEEVIVEDSNTENTTKEVEETQPTQESKEKENKESPASVLNLGTPLHFDKNEKHSFSEWLNLTKLKPIVREEPTSIKLIEEKTETPTTDQKAKKFELIEKFINENPKIDPLRTTQSKGNIAIAQMIKPESLMTETLARIYVEQKNYKSAIQSYKILSLKYPEKSSFFASQIEAIKELQEQNNKL